MNLKSIELGGFPVVFFDQNTRRASGVHRRAAARSRISRFTAILLLPWRLPTCSNCRTIFR